MSGLQVKMLKCTFSGCDYSHKYPYWIKQHEKYHSSDPKVRHPFACKYCEYRFGSKHKLKGHMVLHTEGKKFICSVSGCEYRTHNKEYFRSHEKMHEVTELSCTFEGCSYKSKFNSKLKKHFATHHSGGGREKKVECPLCSKKFYNLEFMQNHLRIHTKEKPLKCSVCSFETHRIYLLNHHLHAAHNEHPKGQERGRLECNLCNFTSSYPSRFKRHAASHLEERPYACQFPGCNASYKRKDMLQNHTISLHSPESHHCPEPGCTYVAKNRYLIPPHLKVHRKRFPCVYPGCQREFHNEVGLLNHKSLHDPNREYQCDRCPYRFARKHQLNNHVQQMHLEKKQSQCAHCGKTLSTLTSLRLHVRKFHPEIRFSCPEPGCTYENLSNYDISEHARMWHDEKRPFRCEHCTHRFPLSSYLDEHRSKCSRNPNRFCESYATATDAEYECKACHSVFGDHKSFLKHTVLHRVARVILTRLDVKLQ